MPVMLEIHPSSVIHPSVKLSDNITIGPFCVVGEGVSIGEGSVLHSHVSIGKNTKIGCRNEFFPFSSIGEKTQDLKYKGEPTYLEIGDDNVFRENVTIHRSTTAATKTIIGNHNLFLINSHLAHECHVGNHVILSAYCGIAGHVEIGDYAILSGFAASHQFVRIGEHSFVGGCCRVVKDVPPYMIVEGQDPVVRAINMVGLQRRGFSEDDLRALKLLYKKVFLHKNAVLGEVFPELLAEGKYANNACLKRVIDFMQTSERGCYR